jgi:hypothetical protein
MRKFTVRILYLCGYFGEMLREIKEKLLKLNPPGSGIQIA